MLTEIEKQHIRQEVIYRCLVERECALPDDEEKSKAQKFWSRIFKLWEGCSHPVIVTVIGGIILACTGAWFQSIWDSRKETTAHYRQLQLAKIEVVEKFCNEFERDMTCLRNIRRPEVFLRSGKEKNEIGTTSADVRVQRNEMVKFYEENCHPLAVIAEVEAIFSTSDCKVAAKDLEDSTRELLNFNLVKESVKYPTDEEMENHLDKLTSATQDKYLTLTKAFITEVQREPE